MNESLAIEVKIYMPRIKIMNDAKHFIFSFVLSTVYQ